MNRVLLVAHHFPPDASVGALRPAKFSKYLPEFGWEPIVLTVDERYHDNLDRSQPECNERFIKVIRSRFVRNPNSYYRALKRPLCGSNAHHGPKLPQPRAVMLDAGNEDRPTIKDWFNALVAFPDEHTGWIPFALLAGREAIRQGRIRCILTSGPPHSTHLIGAWLSRWASLPWIADFRDPLFLPGHTRFIQGWLNPALPRLEKRLEAYIVSRATSLLTTTERLTQHLRGRYPEWVDRFETIENGYDPDDFRRVSQAKADVFTISYLGTLYGTRDPEPVLRAIASLTRDDRIDSRCVRLRFVGHCEEANGQPTRLLAAKYGLEEVVDVMPWLPRESALAVMAQSHVLLLLAEDVEFQIPAKIFDYLGSGSDILALTGESATADLLRGVNTATLHSPNDEDGIKRAVERAYWKFLGARDDASMKRADLTRYSRRTLTERLSIVLDRTVRGSAVEGTAI